MVGDLIAGASALPRRITHMTLVTYSATELVAELVCDPRSAPAEP